MTMEKTFDPDMIQPDTVYGITLNPNIQCYTAPSDFRFICAYSNAVQKIFEMEDSPLETIELFPEISPCFDHTAGNPQPRLHFHGRCVIDPLLYYQGGAEKMSEHFHVHIDKRPSYNYSTKNESVMRLFLKKNKIESYSITFANKRNPVYMRRLKGWDMMSSSYSSPKDQMTKACHVDITAEQEKVALDIL